MAAVAATDPSNPMMDIETSDNPHSVAESGSNNNNTSATDTMDTRNATGTLDEDSSSIEALNWIEFDEEEMACAKNPDFDKKEGGMMDAENEEVTARSSNGPSLSTSLLKTIDSQMPEDDKITKIENWASEVISATEDELLGELETVAEGGEISVSTSSTTVYKQVPESEEASENGDKGNRKRASKSLMAMSTISSLSTVDSKGDPLSNAPVLDEGPIWGKGSKRYKFQENRRFNQKLTFGVLLSVVLAIGLGLGNLVAYNECEAEYKATTPAANAPPSPVKTPAEDKLHSAEDMLHSAEDMLHSPEVPNQPLPTVTIEKAQDIRELESPEILQDNIIENTAVPEKVSVIDSPAPAEINEESQKDHMEVLAKVTEKPSKEPPKVSNNKPFVDPSYATHAEALASVVKSLDQLSRKIDQFQNTTRQLGGIVMLKEEVIKELRSKSNAKDTKEKEKSDDALEEKVYPDLSEEELTLDDLEETEDMMMAEDLIDAIEENEAFEEKQFHKGRLEEIRKMKEEEDLESGHIEDETYKTMEDLIRKYIDEIEELDKIFIEGERAKVLDEKEKKKAEGKFVNHLGRNFDDYSDVEKKDVLARYRKFKKDYEAEHNLASVTKRLLEEQLQSEKAIDDTVEEISLEIMEGTNNSKDNDNILNDEEPVLKTDNEGDSNLENFNEDIEPEKNDDIVLLAMKSKMPPIPENSIVNESGTDTQMYDESGENIEKVKHKKKRDKKSPAKDKKKENQNEKESKPHKSKSQRNYDKHDKSFNEENNLKKTGRKKRSLEENDRKKWSELKSDEKRYKYANENSNQNQGKRNKVEKGEKFGDNHAQSLEEEDRHHDQRSRWKKSEKNWATDRAKLREHNRKNNYDDSNVYLSKKNKNWQLERDKAREKFRNKNKHFDD